MRNIKFLTLFLVVMLMASSAFAFKPIEVSEGKYLKFFYEGQFGLTMRNTGSGDGNEDDTADFNFRRNRFGFIGTYNDRLSFYVQTEYIDDKSVNALTVKDSLTDDENFYVLDAQIRYVHNNAFKVTLGKFKHNLTRENLEGCFTPLNFDRSLFVAAPFKTSRDYGVTVFGNLASDYLQYRFDVMEGRESGGEGDSRYVPNSGFRYTGRVHFTMFDKETGYGYQGSYLGEKKVLTVGASYQYEADVAYKDAVNRSDEVDYNAYSLDFFTEMPTSAGTFTLSAAYLNIDLDDLDEGANPDTALTDDVANGIFNGNAGQREGYYVKAGYMLPMEIGPGKLQFFGRYDSFEYATLNGYKDNTVDFYAFGANYYLAGNDIKIVGQYSITDFEDEVGADTNRQDFDTFEMFLQVRF
jgi:hypothetical protein